MWYNICVADGVLISFWFCKRSITHTHTHTQHTHRHTDTFWPWVYFVHALYCAGCILTLWLVEVIYATQQSEVYLHCFTDHHFHIVIPVYCNQLLESDQQVNDDVMMTSWLANGFCITANSLIIYDGITLMKHYCVTYLYLFICLALFINASVHVCLWVLRIYGLSGILVSETYTRQSTAKCPTYLPVCGAKNLGIIARLTRERECAWWVTCWVRTLLSIQRYRLTNTIPIMEIRQA